MNGAAIRIVELLTEHRERCESVIERWCEGDSAGAESELALLCREVQPQAARQLAEFLQRVFALQPTAHAKLSSPDALPKPDALSNPSAIDPARPNPVWWATEKSLQQATPWQVARVKAGWFGTDPVFDLCCGIGGDAVQLAARGAVTAVDLDPLIAAMARANVRRAAPADCDATVLCEDVTAVGLPRLPSIHLDPDRRARETRRSDPNRFEPAWDQVTRLIARSSAAVVKLAPASQVPSGELPVTEFHRCWISLSGSVREQSLLWGTALRRANLTPGERSALVLRSDGAATWFSPDRPAATTRPALFSGTPSVLVDPNPAVRAAHLTEGFANEHGLGLLGGPSGFLAGDESLIDSVTSLRPLAVAAVVKWWGSCDDRKLRKTFRGLNVFPQTVKVRGTDHDPAVLVKRYRQCGEHPVMLWIGRQGKRAFAAITDLVS